MLHPIINQRLLRLSAFAILTVSLASAATFGRVVPIGGHASDIALDDWTICGSPRDCVETIERGRAMGLDKIGVTIYSLPREVQARIDYLQMIAEQILRPAGALA